MERKIKQIFPIACSKKLFHVSRFGNYVIQREYSEADFTRCSAPHTSRESRSKVVRMKRTV